MSYGKSGEATCSRFTMSKSQHNRQSGSQLSGGGHRDSNSHASAVQDGNMKAESASIRKRIARWGANKMHAKCMQGRVRCQTVKSKETSDIKPDRHIVGQSAQVLSIEMSRETPSE